MRAAVVSSATLAKYDRWDAAFYVKGFAATKDCGSDEDVDVAIARAEKTLAQAQARVARLRVLKQQVDARRQAMIDSGEVVPIPDREINPP